MKLKHIITLIMLYTALPSFSQTGLQIGDKIPDITIPHLFNYKTPSANISDFKGKLLILDFWGTWCSPCVANLPKMDSLQKLFSGKVQFLPITDEPLEKIERFSQHFSKAKNLDLMTVYDDRTIRKLFAFNTLPFYVWIDDQGTIIARTSSEEITVKNLEKALQKNLSGLANRIDEKILGVDQNKTIFNLHINYQKEKNLEAQLTIDSNAIIGQSIATRYVPGLTSITKNDVNHYFSANVSISNLYSHLFLFMYYGQMTMGIAAESRIRYEITDPNKLAQIKNDSWGQEYEQFLTKNGKCYEIIWPSSTLIDVKAKFNWVKQDLDKYFGEPLGIKADIEQRMVERCMVLEKIGSTSLLKTKGNKPREAYEMYNYEMENTDFSRFFNRLSGYYFQQSEMPLIDESGIKGSVDLELKCNMRSLEEINNNLYKYGLKINIKPALADVLVFKDK